MTEPFLEEIRAFEQRDRQCPPPAGGVLFLGSSTIRLWASLREDFPGIAIVNRGFGGSQIEDSIRYADRIILPYRPRQIIFYAGDNDLASGKTPERVSADYEALVDIVLSRLPRVTMVFISIKPSPSRAMLLAEIRKANSLIAEFVEPQARLKFADVFEQMLGPDGAPQPELFTEDGLHMNARGYRIWKRVLQPYLIE